MKKALLLWTAALALTVGLVTADTARLGTLASDSKVMVEGLYPVFEIRVPDTYVEVQVRASLTNFEPGVLLNDTVGGVTTSVYNYIPTGATVNGRKEYRALGTSFYARYQPSNAIYAGWHWEFIGYPGAPTLYSTSTATNPWDIAGNTFQNKQTNHTYALPKEFFVYWFCTTGEAGQPATWGKGTGDPDAWVYVTNQTVNAAEGLQYKRVKWDQGHSMASQLQAGGTPGYTILFQPSRGSLGAIEWMDQNNIKLVWIYQVETGSGVKPKHPDGTTDVWNSLYPSEWRKARIELFTP